MSNLFAAIGRIQLKRLTNEFGPNRIKLAKRYREQLVKITGIQLLDTQLEPIIPHIQPVRVLGNRRNELRSALRDQGIQTGIHYKPNHLLSFYGGGKVCLPVCEKLYGELLSLPLHPGLTLNDIDKVCHAVAKFMTP
jgi:dTDP-4-amino-4,6-dideoxygalactose transaminase